MSRKEFFGKKIKTDFNMHISWFRKLLNVSVLYKILIMLPQFGQFLLHFLRLFIAKSLFYKLERQKRNIKAKFKFVLTL